MMDDFIEYCFSKRQEIIKALNIIYLVQKQLHPGGAKLNGLSAYLGDKSLSLAIEGDYVDKNGYDVECCGKKISCKSRRQAFLVNKNESTTFIIAKKLRNDIIESTGKRIEDISYDYIIFIQTCIIGKKNIRYPSLGISRYDDVKNLIKETPYSYTLRVPFELMTFIVHPNENIITPCNSKDFIENLRVLNEIGSGDFIKKLNNSYDQKTL
jgi:hypothetical protein